MQLMKIIKYQSIANKLNINFILEVFIGRISAIIYLGIKRCLSGAESSHLHLAQSLFE